VDFQITMKLTTVSAALAGFLVTADASLYGESDLNHTCVLVPDYLSCSSQANPATVDACCVETFGGLVVQTQYWNTYTGLEAEGQLLPPDSWSIHGLWPDFCNGSYTQYCDLNRQYDPSPSPNTTNGLANGTVVPPYNGSNIGTFLEPFGRYDLLAYMNKYWINQGAPNYDFWGHEFSKHATCYSTFDVPCYGPEYRKHEDVVDFFETVIKYYMKRPTFTWLKKHNIVPSNSTSYTLSDLEGALLKEYGGVPYLGCTGPKFNETAAGANSTDSGRTVLDELWYYSHVYGRVQDGNAVHINQTGTSGCAKAEGAIWYYERTNSSVAHY
jgi:ribonuclease T2